MKRLTLQWRITLLAAIILAISSVVLTAVSMFNAEKSFMALIEENSIYSSQAVDALPAGEGTIDTMVGEAATPAQIAKRNFDFWSILFCILVTTLGTVAVYYMAGKALRPLRKLSGAVETIDEHNLSQRMPEAMAQDEVGVLTDGFNEMLTRLDDAFLRQKRFTANAAHELKTPLATLKTGVQVLSADPASTLEDYQEHAEKTLLAVDRMTAIVNDLLLLASVGENAVREREAILLGPLFEAIQSELSDLIEQKNILFEIDCKDFYVMGDAALLYRAFFNLVENACKYGCQGGHIQANAKQDADCISVSIKDDGPGIGAEHLPYIFDAFYRVDKSRSRDMGGSGLGLSIVKTMIEAIGGTITVESDGKSGSCFTAVFPSE